MASTPIGEPDHGPAGAALIVRGLTKRFWGTRALDDVSLEVLPGQVRALLGQNGAGKSTLIKILAGVYQADAGTVEVDGADPRAGSAIAFIHQDRGLAPGMTVAENIALTRGYATGRGGLVSWRRVLEQAREVLDLLELDLDPHADVAELTLAERALVAIARAMSTRASFIVLDEPTAALPASVVDQLIDTIRRLRKEGVGFLYVTHRIDEIFPLADTVTVLRDGRVIMDTTVARVSREQLVRAIVGKDLAASHKDEAPLRTGTPLLDLREVIVGGTGPVTMQVARGEIVGLVGLGGAGQNDIGRAIAGVASPTSGSMSLDGRSHTPTSAASALKDGVGFVPGDRLEESLAPELTVQENLYLNPAIPSQRTLRPRSRRREQASARDAIERFDVRPRVPTMPISLLSGGNQQKVVVARWIEAGLRTLVLEEPTAGVDIASKAQIHDVLRGVASDGGAVVVVSSDFDEVAQLCDRVVVFSRGQVATELTGDQVDVSAVTGWATGAIDYAATGSQSEKGTAQ